MNRQAETLNQALLAAMEQYADRTCFWVKQGVRYQPISYRRFQSLTFRLTHFFRKQGVTEGARVAIILDKSVEWMAAYMATLFAGGIVVPLRTFLPPEQISLRLRDSEACLVLVENQAQYQIIAEAGEPLPAVRTVVVAHDPPAPTPSQVITLPDLLTKSLSAAKVEASRTTAWAVSPEALAAIYYTVDETNEPRGAVFDQAQCLKTLQLMGEWFTLTENDVGFTTPLPWSYTPNLNVSLLYFLSGVANALTYEAETALEDLQQVSPTVTLTNPNAFDYIYQKIISEMGHLPGFRREVFDWALLVGKEYRAAGQAASDELRRKYARADLTFFSQVRGRLGGRMHRFYTVGAPLFQKDIDFAEIIGLLPLNVYSLTEAGGFPAISRPGGQRNGSCGQIAPGFQIRIAADGEVLVRGQTVMREYWRRPADTQQVLDAEGWLYTGDLGYLDEEGYLYLTGHKQSLMVLSTGRKVNSVRLEAALTDNPFVAQAGIFGEGYPYVSALIVPDLETLANYFQENERNLNLAVMAGPEATTLKWFWPNDDETSQPVTTTAHPVVKQVLDKVVTAVNQQLDSWEYIAQYSLLDQACSKAANELTELKAKGRAHLTAHYATLIESMYPTRLPDEERRTTQVQVSPERLHDLLEKERILDAWLADAGIQFLFDLAGAKHIEAPSMVHVCDIAATIAQMENEEKPLSTAIIVGDPAQIGAVLPPSQIQLLRHDHIRRMRKILVTMAKMVDGKVLGYVVDKYGYVRGVHRLTQIDLEETENFLGPQFRRHAAISKRCDALVFFVPAGGRQVRVFADGKMVGRYANGDWFPDNVTNVAKVIAQLAEGGNYDATLIQRILRCAFQMSEQNFGAIFMIGEANLLLDRADTAEIGAFAAIVGIDLAHLTDQELINFAKQDGATVIDKQGYFRGCMVLLRPDANTPAEIGPGKGARHSSAAKMSAEVHCVAITVSQDGPITIYEQGRRLLSL